jgi:hypothetical protein
MHLNVLLAALLAGIHGGTVSDCSINGEYGETKQQVKLEQLLCRLTTDESFFYLGVCKKPERGRPIENLTQRIHTLQSDYKRVTGRDVQGDIILTEGNGCGRRASLHFNRMILEEKRLIEVAEALMSKLPAAHASDR